MDGVSYSAKTMWAIWSLYEPRNFTPCLDASCSYFSYHSTVMARYFSLYAGHRSAGCLTACITHLHLLRCPEGPDEVHSRLFEGSIYRYLRESVMIRRFAPVDIGPSGPSLPYRL